MPWARTAFAGSLAAWLLLSAASSPAAEARPARTIEVTGEARAEVPADLALLDFGVVTQADTAAAAARENGARMERMLAALRKVVGSEATIGTGRYSIRPLYASTREERTPRLTGYEVSNVVQVKTKALARVGEVIDAAVQAGANQVQQLTFTLSDDGVPKRTALRSAALQAREKAHTVAAALGVKPGAIHSLVETERAVVRPLARQAAIQAESASFTPVEPGLVEVQARVVLTIEIADAGQAP